MKILKKDGSDLLVVASRSENVHRGDYLIIFDDVDSNQLIVQIYDETYLDNPGSTEEIIRGEILQIKGIDASEILKKGCPINFSELKKNNCVGTVFQGMNILLDKYVYNFIVTLKLIYLFYLLQKLRFNIVYVLRLFFICLSLVVYIV